jgi:hypothetical protein
MKQITLIVIGIICLIFLSLGGCRKKTDVGEDLDIATKPRHCYNGEMDEDETTTDCGGSCGSCSDGVIESSCGVPLGKIITIGTGGDTLTVVSSTKTQSGNNLIFTLVVNNGGIFTIVVNKDVVIDYSLDEGGSNPTIYEFSGEVEDLQPFSTTFQYQTDLQESQSGNGVNKILFDGTNYYIDFCGIYFMHGSLQNYYVNVKIYAKVS